MNLTFQQIWAWRKLITIEPLIFCYYMPSLLLYATSEVLPLEKSCRANLKQHPLVCGAIRTKKDLGIVCNTTETDHENPAEALSQDLTKRNFTINGVVTDFLDFQDMVCDAEQKSLALIADNNWVRNVFISCFTLVIVIFACSWSDKKKLRKPLMLSAMIGDLLGTIPQLLSVIYFDEIPMEFAHTLSLVIPAMFGGSSLMTIGCYAYLACITTEENRTARFGIFTIYQTVLITIGPFFGGPLLKALDYVYIHILGTLILVLGVLQIIFFLDDVSDPLDDQTVKQQAVKTGSDNPAFEDIELERDQTTNVESLQQLSTPDTDDVPLLLEVKTFLSEFFDPTSIMDSMKVLFQKHENFGRAILYLCLLNGVFLNCGSSEADYTNKVAILKFQWNENKVGYFLSFNAFVALVGTTIATNIVPKFYQISDGIIGIVGAVGSFISKIAFALASTEVMYWIAQSLDLFAAAKILTIRSILSKVFNENSLAKVYALIAVTDSLLSFVGVPYLYAKVYKAVQETNPSNVFYLSVMFFGPSAVLFVITHYVFEYKRKKPEDANGTAPTSDLRTTKC